MSKNKKYNVVAFGARDYYQIALALNQSNMLGYLITDYYCNDLLREIVKKRFDINLNRKKTISIYPFFLLMKILPKINKFKKINRYITDYLFGFISGFITYITTNNAIVYSYYIEGFVSFYKLINKKPEKLILFQVHPTPIFQNEILHEDRIIFKKITGKQIFKKIDMEETYSIKDINNYFKSINYCNQIICASSFTATSITKYLKIKIPIQVIPYGSKFEYNNNLKTKFKNNFQQDKIKILTISQVSERKGLHWAFEAMSSSEYKDNFDWIIVSNSIDINISRLTPCNVRYLSKLSDEEMYSLYSDADIFLLPSLVEGFGLVYSEALSASLPIVYTRNTGPFDFCTDTVNGFEVKISDMESLQNLLKDLANGRYDLNKMKINSKKLSDSLNWSNFRSTLILSINN